MYIMDLLKTIDTSNNIKLDKSTFVKMTFIYNAVNNGWTVQKKKDKYTFNKPHENRKEVFESSYLESFIKNNIDANKL
jgi:hypothetical protein